MLFLVFGPLFLLAKLNASQKPKNDDPPYSIPVVKINIDMQRLDIKISKLQFQCLILLNDSMERMKKGKYIIKLS